MEKEKKNKKLNQNSFYFEDYKEAELIDNANSSNIIKISLNRVTFLSFIFLSLILIFSIKIIYLSLSTENANQTGNKKLVSSIDKDIVASSIDI